MILLVVAEIGAIIYMALKQVYMRTNKLIIELGMSEAARPVIGEAEPLAYGADSIRRQIDEENIGIQWPREEWE